MFVDRFDSMNSLIAGAAAGAICDLVLHPIDTLKTRLQGKDVLRTRGLFNGVYNGIGAVALGAAPASAAFFYCYETVKLTNIFPASSLGYAASAGIADAVSCLIRVPFEVIKQRTQAMPDGASSFATLKALIKLKGPLSLFDGLTATILRDIPFSFIQFPIYEALKLYAGGGDKCSPELAAVFGSLAGAIAGAITTPLDVVKTRRMLGHSDCSLWQIIKTEGAVSLFKGLGPRVLFISTGGLVWFGTYEKMKQFLSTF